MCIGTLGRETPKCEPYSNRADPPRLLVQSNDVRRKTWARYCLDNDQPALNSQKLLMLSRSLTLGPDFQKILGQS